MFPSPPRPRAPSAATLKVLYQLAYISSGTALGIGALCAEERRRRTKVIQRISDNARRLRQTSRYNHGAAAAAIRDIEAGHEFAIFNHRPHLAGQEGSILAPELPSIISREYDRPRSHEELVGRRRNRRRDSNRGARAADASGQPSALRRLEQAARNSSLSSSGQQGDRSKRTTERPDVAQPLARKRAHGRDDTHLTLLKDVRQKPTRLPDTARYVLRQRSTPEENITYLEEEHSDRRRLSTTLAATSTSRQAISEEFRPNFSTQQYWDAEPGDITEFLKSGKLLPAHIRSDVDMLLDSLGEDTPTHLRPSLDTALSSSSALLALSVSSRAVDDIRSLILWQIAVGQLKVGTVILVASSWTALSAVAGNRAVAYMLSQAFETAAKKEEDQSLLLDAAMRLSIQFFENQYNDDKKIDRADFFPLRYAVDHSKFKHAAEAYCQRLLVEGRVEQALLLFTSLPFKGWPTNMRQSLIRATFKASVSAGLVSDCAKLLSWANSSLELSSIASEEIEAYILLCGRMAAYGTLRALFSSRENAVASNVEHLKQLLTSRSLSEESCMQLSLAFVESSDTCDAALKICYDHLSMENKAVVSSKLIAAQAASLNSQWLKTRNLDSAVQVYRTALRRYEGDAAHEDVELLHTTMARIALEANDPKEAARIIRALDCRQEESSSAVLLGCLLFAQRNDWQSLQSLLFSSAISKALVPKWTAESVKVLERIMQAYATQHDAQELQLFCKRAVDDLGFPMNRRTTVILLRKFIVDMRIDLIDTWLTGQQQNGLAVEIDGLLIAQLLLQLFHAHQPSHVWLLEQSHDLLLTRPHLARAALRNALTVMAAYDIHNSKSQHSPRQIAEAEERLNMLGGSQDLLQIPGKMQEDRLRTKNGLSQRAAAQQYPASHESPDLSVLLQSAAEPSRGLSASPPAAFGPSAYKNSSELMLGEQERSDQDPTSPVDPVAVSLESLFHFVEPFEESAPARDKYSKGPGSRKTRADHRVLNDDYLFSGLLRSSGLLDAQQSTGRDSGFGLGDSNKSQSPLSLRAESLPSSEFFDPDPSGQVHSFLDLRADYSEPSLQQAPAADSAGSAAPTPAQLHSHMLTALLTRKYGDVLTTYHKHLDKQGTASSPLALELAVEASLRIHDGDDAEAAAILASAHTAGMNTTCAVGPLLLHRTRRLKHIDAATAQALRRDVVQYYRQNQENGWPVKHHLATDVAHRLIHPSHGHSAHSHLGIALLEEVYNSHWARQRPLDIVAMTVWVAGYGRLRNLDGIARIVDRVLEQNLRIDEHFISVLQRVKTYFRRTARDVDDSAESYASIVNRINEMKRKCVDRRAAHKLEVTEFSRKFVRVIAKHTGNPDDVLLLKYAYEPRSRSWSSRSKTKATHTPAAIEVAG